MADIQMDNALYKLIENKTPELAIQLLNSDTNYNIDCYSDELNKTTPLMTASYLDMTEVVSLLIIKGANLNLRDLTGMTALSHAAKDGNVDIVKILVAAKCDLNIVGGINEWTGQCRWSPLMIASSEGHIAIVDELLKGSADLHIKDFDGNTALMLAALNGHTDVIVMLHEKGADINTVNKDKRNALLLTLRKERNPTITALKLIELGCDHTLIDKDGKTASNYACWRPIIMEAINQLKK